MLPPNSEDGGNRGNEWAKQLAVMSRRKTATEPAAEPGSPASALCTLLKARNSSLGIEGRSPTSQSPDLTIAPHGYVSASANKSSPLNLGYLLAVISVESN